MCPQCSGLRCQSARISRHGWIEKKGTEAHLPSFALQMEDSTPPRDIEQVPFRRQDRRILNSRKKRVMDRKLIRCILMTGLLMVAAGAGLIAVWWMYEEGE